MYRTAITGIIIALFLLVNPAISREFAASDFDPADPDLAEEYRAAVIDLIKEMTIVGEDNNGNELFTAVPFPLELVALMTQLEIHESNITDPDELDDLLDEQDYIKPASNSFAFVLDGDPEWVMGQVFMGYTSGSSPFPVELEVLPISSDYPDETSAVTTWAVVIEDGEQLEEFLDAGEVSLAIWNGNEGQDPIILDCGYWRFWGLFDLREEVEMVED